MGISKVQVGKEKNLTSEKVELNERLVLSNSFRGKSKVCREDKANF